MASQNPLPYRNYEKSSGDNSSAADSLANVRSHHAGLAINDRDWDALFDAVRERLSDSVSEPSACRSTEPCADSYVPRTTFALQNLRVQVLDCVEGLAKLHAELRIKRALVSQSLKPECELLSPEAKQ